MQLTSPFFTLKQISSFFTILSQRISFYKFSAYQIKNPLNITLSGNHETEKTDVLADGSFFLRKVTHNQHHPFLFGERSVNKSGAPPLLIEI
jgi:hypothetical protein